MKLIIAGSRDLYVSSVFIDAVCGTLDIPDAGTQPPSEIVSGGARGIDSCGETFARDLGIPLRTFPADWTTHGKAAGPMRNRQMADYADALLLIWDGSSRGSANMRREMMDRKKPVFEVILRRCA